MPKQERKWFDSIGFLKNQLSPVQKCVTSLVNAPGVMLLYLTGCRQFGKSYWVYDYLLKAIYRSKDKNFAVIIPLDTELNRFLTEQLVKPFGKDTNGRKCENIEDVRVPVQTETKQKMQQFVTKFDKSSGTPVIHFHNGCKLFFFAANANPEQHIPGNTFELVVADEVSKYAYDISHIVIPTLMHSNGVFIGTTTLNEDDPENWFAIDILNEYKEKGIKVLPQKDPQLFCGLDVYKKEINEVIEIVNAAGEIKVEEMNAKSLLVIGDFENIYPWIYNGEEVYKYVLKQRALGNITETAWQVLYKCNPKVASTRVIVNYDPTINELQWDERINSIKGYLVGGYDHGKGSTIDNRCAAGWAKVLCLYDENNPKFEQYIILESGRFQDEEAELSNVSRFLEHLNMPIGCDSSLFKKSFAGNTIHDSPDIFRFYNHQKNLRNKLLPSSGEKLANNSRLRKTFWEKGLKLSLPIQEAIREHKKTMEYKVNGIEFDTQNYIFYTHPIYKDKPGCQIYIVVDKYDESRNAQLRKEIKNWKKTKNKEGKLIEPKNAEIDVWDAASMAILTWQMNREIIINFYNKSNKQIKKTKKYINLNPAGGIKLQKGMTLESFTVKNNFL